MLADRLKTLAIISGTLGLLGATPALLAFGQVGWAAEGLLICGVAAAAGQAAKKNRDERRLLADLQEHYAALRPEGAAMPPTSIGAAARAIVDSAEQIVSDASARSTGLESRVRELSVELRVTRMSLEMAEATLQVAASSVHTTDAEEQLVLATATDGSGREAASHGSQPLGRDSNEIKSEFVSKVSHELRTPLASIKAYVEMLIDGEASDAETQKKFYEIIQDEANRLGKLIDGTVRSAA